MIEQYENKIQILVNKKLNIDEKADDVIIFQTHEDHRLAMSFGVLSTFLSKKFPKTRFIIDSKIAVQKTFPQFWKYLTQSGVNLEYNCSSNLKNNKLNFG